MLLFALNPVITSVSVLFASLVGLTISNLHARQAEIHKTLILEVQYLRELQQLVLQENSNPQEDPTTTAAFLRNCLMAHAQLLLSRPYARSSDSIAADPHAYIASSLAPLLLHQQNVADRVRAILHQRSLRWLALHAAPFPLVHYGTLGVLVMAIVVSFLVATTMAEQPIAFGLPVRLLWAVLWTSFAALGSVCYDLAQPFGGCYHIAA